MIRDREIECGDGVPPARRAGCGDGVSPSRRGGCGDGVSPSRRGGCGDGVSPSRDGDDAVATANFRTPSPFFPGKDGMNGILTRMGNALPRWLVDGVVYHVCFRLFDSVPQAKLREWNAAREQFRKRQKSGVQMTDGEVLALKNLYSETIERYLDSGYGECLLARPGVADILIDTIRQGEKTDVAMASRHRATAMTPSPQRKLCRIHAYGIMPNHAHVLVEIPDKGLLIRLMQVWKSASSHRINRLLGRKGQVWQTDYYNHIVRTAREYEHQKAYALKNSMVASWALDTECGDGVPQSRDGEDAVATTTPATKADERCLR